MRRNAFVTRAKNGMDPIESLDSCAAAARIPLIALIVSRIVKVVATGALQEISRHCWPYSAIAGKRQQESPASTTDNEYEQGCDSPSSALRGERSQADTAVRQFFDCRKLQSIDVDQLGRLLDALLH